MIMDLGIGCRREVCRSNAVESHSKQKYGLTPISCHAVLERSACAPFIKERRMECLDATSLRRKSGQMGHPAFVAGEASSYSFPRGARLGRAPHDIEGPAPGS